MSRMVYCNYVKNTNDSVTYAYGGTVNDITGEVIFCFTEDVVEVTKVPKTEDAPKRHIMRLYGAQRDNFLKGIFKEKISYES